MAYPILKLNDLSTSGLDRKINHVISLLQSGASKAPFTLRISPNCPGSDAPRSSARNLLWANGRKRISKPPSSRCLNSRHGLR